MGCCDGHKPDNGYYHIRPLFSLKKNTKLIEKTTTIIYNMYKQCEFSFMEEFKTLPKFRMEYRYVILNPDAKLRVTILGDEQLTFNFNEWPIK